MLLIVVLVVGAYGVNGADGVDGGGWWGLRVDRMLMVLIDAGGASKEERRVVFTRTI